MKHSKLFEFIMIYMQFVGLRSVTDSLRVIISISKITYMRKNSFSQRVVNEWNALPSYTVNASSINVFKIYLDRCLNEIRSHI